MGEQRARKLQIAILGTRGVPPAYGGFETFAAELGTRLVARGHDVTVYCRRPALEGSARALTQPTRSLSDSPSRPLADSPSHSLTDSPTHPLADSPTHSLSDSPTRPLADSPTRPLADSPTRPLADSPTHRLTDSPTRPLGDSPTHRLADSPTHSLTDSPTRPLADSPTRRLAHSPAHPLTDTCADSWHGIHRIELPHVPGKYLETVSHTFVSALDALRRDFDVVLLCNAANAFVLPLLRAARIPVAINVDGIERRRRKWNVLGRAVYATGETFSVSFASAVVADAEVIARYYREQYAAPTHVIPYGAEFPAEEDSDVLERLGLRARDYILYVSRFEPENNPLEVVLAYEKLRAGRRTDPLPPLVMLGKGLYAPDLVVELHRHASDRILFPGALYGADYRTLQRNAAIYLQATEVGGTHPALVEAMASGGAVLAHDTPENREVGGDAVGYFDLRPTETLSGLLAEWLANPMKREEFRARARRRAAERYSWDAVTDQYETLFRNMV